MSEGAAREALDYPRPHFRPYMCDRFSTPLHAYTDAKKQTKMTFISIDILDIISCRNAFWYL